MAHTRAKRKAEEEPDEVEKMEASKVSKTGSTDTAIPSRSRTKSRSPETSKTRSNATGKNAADAETSPSNKADAFKAHLSEESESLAMGRLLLRGVLLESHPAGREAQISRDVPHTQESATQDDAVELATKKYNVKESEIRTALSVLNLAFQEDLDEEDLTPDLLAWICSEIAEAKKHQGNTSAMLEADFRYLTSPPSSAQPSRTSRRLDKELSAFRAGETSVSRAKELMQKLADDRTRGLIWGALVGDAFGSAGPQTAVFPIFRQGHQRIFEMTTFPATLAADQPNHTLPPGLHTFPGTMLLATADAMVRQRGTFVDVEVLLRMTAATLHGSYGAVKDSKNRHVLYGNIPSGWQDAIELWQPRRYELQVGSANVEDRTPGIIAGDSPSRKISKHADTQQMRNGKIMAWGYSEILQMFNAGLAARPQRCDRSDPIVDILDDPPIGADAGSLVAVAPLAASSMNQAALIRAARDHAALAHGWVGCGDLNALMALLVRDALTGCRKEEMCARVNAFPAEDRSLRFRLIDSPSSPVAWSALRGTDMTPESTVELVFFTAVWAFMGTHSFEEGMVAATNIGILPSYVGCVYGSLAGAFYGNLEVPARWKDALAEMKAISRVVDSFAQTMAGVRRNVEGVRTAEREVYDRSILKWLDSDAYSSSAGTWRLDDWA